MLNLTGKCVPCPRFTRANGFKKENQFIECKADRCYNEILKEDGTCEMCGRY